MVCVLYVEGSPYCHSQRFGHSEPNLTAGKIAAAEKCEQEAGSWPAEVEMEVVGGGSESQAGQRAVHGRQATKQHSHLHLQCVLLQVGTAYLYCFSICLTFRRSAGTFTTSG